MTQPVQLPRSFIDKPDILPFTIEVDPPMVSLEIANEIDLATANANLDVTATLTLPRVLVRAKSDPSLLLAFTATYEQRFKADKGQTSGKLTALENRRALSDQADCASGRGYRRPGEGVSTSDAGH
jgi:hypothetical protein